MKVSNNLLLGVILILVFNLLAVVFFLNPRPYDFNEFIAKKHKESFDTNEELSQLYPLEEGMTSTRISVIQVVDSLTYSVSNQLFSYHYYHNPVTNQKEKYLGIMGKFYLLEN